MNENTNKHRISLPMAVFLIGAAFLVDALQGIFVLLAAAGAAIPIPGIDVVAGAAFGIVAFFLGIAADVVFLIWLYFLGVSYTGKGALLKWATIGGMTAITAIPGLDFLPELTIGITTLVVQTRLEDTVKIRAAAGAAQTAAKVAGAVQPGLAGALKVADLDARRREAARQVRENRAAANDNELGEEERAAANDNEPGEEQLAA